MVVLVPRYWCQGLQVLLLLHLTVWSREDEGTDGGETEGHTAAAAGGGGGGNTTGGSQPYFLHDQLTLNVSVQLDSTVHLHCRIQGIKDQSVSWYRKKGSEIHLITFGFQTYHNDDRFALIFEQPEDWQLRIRYVQRHDEEASIQILDERGVEVGEKFYRVGSTMELQCQVSDMPTTTALHIAWYHHDHRLNYDDSRGGVSLKTELRGSVARSWLRVSNAVKEDSGTYYCNVTNLASTNVTIHVVTDEYPAAIQRGSKLSCWSLTQLASILTSITAACLHPHR